MGTADTPTVTESSQFENDLVWVRENSDIPDQCCLPYHLMRRGHRDRESPRSSPGVLLQESSQPPRGSRRTTFKRPSWLACGSTTAKGVADSRQDRIDGRSANKRLTQAVSTLWNGDSRSRPLPLWGRALAFCGLRTCWASDCL